MFKGGQPNPYDDIVNKTTDENLTSENWELILNLCDKVQDEGQEGAHNVIAAVLKRLAHRNPNVQLYALSLAEALSKNCTIELHREIASRSFTQGLEKIITDRTTHEKVKRRALGLIAEWTAEFEKDSTLGVMEDCYNSLKAKNYKFDVLQEAPPPAVDDEVRRREEEELQRVLEMSMRDKGGRNQWQYSATSSTGAGGSGSRSKTTQASTSGSSSIPDPAPSGDFAPPSYSAGYVRARTPPPRTPTPTAPTHTSVTPPAATSPHPFVATPTSEPTAAPPLATNITVVTRVRALHTFEPTEPGELAFEKGDVIKVVDRGYKDWWRGQLKGRTGIFPVNYVEPMPEPTAAELAQEAEKEAAVFAQAANVDKLLSMLRSLDPASDNLADNEEIQELYRSSMALRPKIVKLIDKYSQKRADLVSMNETFVRAKTIFDRMMEESLARRVYESQPTFRNQYQGGPDARARPEYAGSPGPQPYGWNASSYDQSAYFPAQATSYPPGSEGAFPTPTSQYVDPAAYAQLQAIYPQAYVQAPYGPQGPNPYPAQTQQPMQPEAAVSPQLQQPQQQQQLQIIPPHQVQATQQQQQLAAAQPQPTPPYTFDPNGTYADPNVQAWAKYYAQGGKDLAGSVYFISIPGVTDGAPQLSPGPSQNPQSPHTRSAQPVQQQPAQVPGHQASGESSGYAGQQSQSSAVSQSNLSMQTSHIADSYGSSRPTSSYTTNPTSLPWAPTVTSPASSNPPDQIHVSHQHSTTGSPPPSTLPTDTIAPLHPLHQATASQSHGPVNIHGEMPPGNTDGTHDDSTGLSGSLEVGGKANATQFSQPNQFAETNVVDDGQALHPEQQHQPQGVGAPA